MVTWSVCPRSSVVGSFFWFVRRSTQGFSVLAQDSLGRANAHGVEVRRLRLLQDEILEEMRKVTDGVVDVIIYPNDGSSHHLREQRGFLTGLTRGNTEEGAKCVDRRDIPRRTDRHPTVT